MIENNGISQSLKIKLSQKRIFESWWPLAASWLLMGLELPVLSAVLARLEAPEINLAAYGGVVFPLALLIESPIIMLLAASTALSKDWASYLKLNRFMWITGIGLTILHVLLAFTELYDVIVVGMFSPPEEIVEPARIGLMIITPWTMAIAYRRFNQGVLIRFGYARAVTLGTVTRLLSLCCILTVGYFIGSISGIIVGSSAIAIAVTSEAIYIGFRVHSVSQNYLKPAPPVNPPLTYRTFAKFYIPLMMTSLLTLIIFPIGTAAISRMPYPLESLAVWPVISGFLFLFISIGIAYNEVVVSLMDEPGAARPLQWFATMLALITAFLLLLITATPIAMLWFQNLSGLSPELALLAKKSMWFALPRPSLGVMQSWYQGTIIHHRNTRVITEAVVIFLVITCTILWFGVVWGKITGVYVAQIAIVIGTLIQTAWLGKGSRPALQTTENL